jgi:predicted secreted protein
MHHSNPLSALAAVFLISFGGSTLHAGDPKPITVSVEQSGTTITLSKVQPLIVRLPAQLGTGFSWAVLNDGQAPLRLASSRIEHSDPGRPGGAETQVFLFEPTGAGVGVIDFGYRQPWMADHSPERSFTVHVIVDGQGSP